MRGRSNFELKLQLMIPNCTFVRQWLETGCALRALHVWHPYWWLGYTKIAPSLYYMRITERARILLYEYEQ